MKLSIFVTAALSVLLVAGCSWHEVMEQGANSPSPQDVVVLDESNFDSQVQSGIVLVEFWASDCEPCEMQGSVIEKVVEQVQGKARVAKLDVDAAPRVAQRYEIQVIPTFVVFKDGKPWIQYVGVSKVEALVSAVTWAIDSK